MTEEIRRFLVRRKLQKKAEANREMISIFKTIKATRSSTSFFGSLNSIATSSK